MIKKIAAFGASVTEQENGYVDCLSDLFKIKIRKYGYGGMHLSDAGICFINNVIKYKPDLCIIDWFSTGYMDCSEKTLACIDTLLYSFSNIGCACVFLLFPFQEDLEITLQKNKFYDFTRNALQSRNAYYLDLASEIPEGEYSKYLRDTIHTNEVGARKYSEIIFDKLSKNYPSVLMPEKFLGNAIYKDIKKLIVNRVFLKNISFKLDGEIIGMFDTIGRHSGVCKVYKDSESELKVQLWDRWCHYERNHFDFSIPYYQGKVLIQVLQDVVDTSSCKLPIDFSKYKKHIMCREVYWQGKSLLFENITEGSKFEFRKMELIRILKEVKHILIKTIRRK